MRMKAFGALAALLTVLLTDAKGDTVEAERAAVEQKAVNIFKAGRECHLSYAYFHLTSRHTYLHLITVCLPKMMLRGQCGDPKRMGAWANENYQRKISTTIRDHTAKGDGTTRTTKDGRVIKHEGRLQMGVARFIRSQAAAETNEQLNAAVAAEAGIQLPTADEADPLRPARRGTSLPQRRPGRKLSALRAGHPRAGAQAAAGPRNPAHNQS